MKEREGIYLYFNNYISIFIAIQPTTLVIENKIFAQLQYMDYIKHFASTNFTNYP